MNETDVTGVNGRDGWDGRGRTRRKQCGPYTVLTPPAACNKNGQTERTGRTWTDVDGWTWTDVDGTDGTDMDGRGQTYQNEDKN